MADFRFGMNAKAYFATVAATPPDLSTMTEIGNIINVNKSTQAATADCTTRANNGWRIKGQTLKELTVDIEMMFKVNDPFYTALKAAYFGNGEIHLAFLTGARELEGSEGPKCNFIVSKFDVKEELEDAIKISATVEPSSTPQWIEIEAP